MQDQLETLKAEYHNLANELEKAGSDTMYHSRNGNYSSPAYRAASKARAEADAAMQQFVAAHPAVVASIATDRSSRIGTGVDRALRGQD